MDDHTLKRDAEALAGALLRLRSGSRLREPSGDAGGAGPDEPHVTLEPTSSSADTVLRDGAPPTTVPGSHRSQMAAAGESIGRYKLLQEIGVGGFGVVWEAEQREPVRRRVALKIIKLGMDTREVVARFEAERQALALMDHPNIARVFDGGATETGRPYFVMELVSGVPLTRYCDTHKLAVRERLELFIPVCHAVQHAHQKGVIHRDIKPSNILVALVDGRPVPKIIDFGIARATSQQLTERTLFTQAGQLIGTPEYMSPEQAGMSGMDVDTRTDVYSLGVVLYELLTGQTPLDRERLRYVAYAEIQRLVCDEEPPRPSTRVSTLGAKIADIAARRHIEPERLGRELRGDLDWIVMRALEKDRTRRYETATGLAQDVQRYLNREPVTAGPPTVAYRVKKFVDRNRAGVALASAFAVVLVVSSVVSVWQAVRATRANRLAGERLIAVQRQEKIAVQEKQRAEAAREDAEGLVAFLLTDLKDGLAPIGRVDIMRGIAEAVQDYYARDDAGLRSAAAQLRLGQALGVLATVAENTGRAEDADRLNRQSIRTLEEWIAAQGRTPEAVRALVEAHERQALFLQSPRWGREPDLAGEQSSLQAAVGLLRELHASREAAIEDRWHLLLTLLQWSQQLRAGGRTAEGAAVLAEAAKLTADEEKRADLPPAGRLAKALILCESVWAQVPPASMPKEWSRLLHAPPPDLMQPVRDLLRDEPDNQRLAEQAWTLASASFRDGAFAGGDVMQHFAVELSTARMNAEPNNLLWAERTAQSLHLMGRGPAGPTAVMNLEKSAGILERLVSLQPWNIALKERLAQVHQRIGEASGRRENLRTALRMLDELANGLEPGESTGYAAALQAARARLIKTLDQR